jgi:hypothetical protein
MKPEAWASSFIIFNAGIPDAVNSLNGNNGIGQYFAGVNISKGAVVRGQPWNGRYNSGIFAVHLNYAATYEATFIGFRCAYSP